MKAPPFRYHRPESLDRAVALIHEFGEVGRFIAGGQSMLPMMNLRLATPEHLVDIGGLPALRETREAGKHRFIGAGVTHAMLEDGKVPDCAQGYLQHVASGIAYRSIRNRGTLGGSLAHADPAADWATALNALNARILVRSVQGEHEVPIGEFQRGLMETALGADELLLGVMLPELTPGARWAYRKFCRKVGELAHSICAVILDPGLALANVVLGAAVDKPVRLPSTSDHLARGLTAGALAGPELADALHGDLVAEVALDPDSYEYQLHRTIVMRTLEEIVKK